MPRTTETTEAPEVAQTPEVEEPATPESPEPRRATRSAGGPAPVMPDAGVSPMRAARAQQHAQVEEPKEEFEYELQQAQIIAMFIQRCNQWKHSRMGKPSIRESFGGFTRGFNRAVQAVSFIETFSLRTGVKKFGSKGTAAAMKEMGQWFGKGSTRCLLEIFRALCGKKSCHLPTRHNTGR